MIREAAGQTRDSTLECDICVVGGGPAGIALALSLARRRRRVCLLESGGEALQSAVQGLYRGAVGTEAFLGLDDYVWSSRLRFLGGSSNHWAGECEPVGDIALAPRPWLPDGSWPLASPELAPWHERAAEWLELGTAEAEPPPAPPGFEGRQPRRSPPIRFGPAHRDALAADPHVDLLLHANAIGLEPNAAGSRVERVRVAAFPGDTRFQVRAARIVLAAGALENARILLAAGPGLGAPRTPVGRYFSDRIEGRVAELLLARPPTAATAPHGGAVIAPTGALQASAELLDTRFRIEPVAARPSGFLRSLGKLLEPLASAGGETAAPEPRACRIYAGMEMAPDPDNRVELSAERDALGVPRLALRAAPGERERAALARAVDRLASGFGQTLLGRVRSELPTGHGWEGLEPARHPSGTTRMHPDPAQGVVDTNCLVHGVANLYVAGSSVFPSSGGGRPTWTLLALALRLADHLADGAA